MFEKKIIATAGTASLINFFSGEICPIFPNFIYFNVNGKWIKNHRKKPIEVPNVAAKTPNF